MLVSRENRPAAWIVGAAHLAELAEGSPSSAQAYQRALQLVAVDLYQCQTLTLGHAAKLAGLSLSDFIDFCSRLRVPILWEPEHGVGAELAAAEALARPA